jgi:hypothetical protein
MIVSNKVRVKTNQEQEKRPAQPEVAKAGQENIETVHEPKPIQTARIIY